MKSNFLKLFAAFFVCSVAISCSHEEVVYTYSEFTASGIVTDGVNPIAGIRVDLSYDGLKFANYSAVFTDAEGRYTLTGKLFSDHRYTGRVYLRATELPLENPEDPLSKPKETIYASKVIDATISAADYTSCEERRCLGNATKTVDFALVLKGIEE